MPATTEPPEPWSARDTLAAVAWFAMAMLARSALASRVEGVLDHDQAVVGLMALDIADGRRWPIFFDGQRYMGALEAYTAAVFVRLLGHSPASVALAPASYSALFVAGQFAAWRAWKGRATGHLAALLALSCSPMMALWGVIPRGGYPEVMAWGLATLVVYRRMTRPDRPSPGPLAQVGWGALFTFGYFLNPLSLVVYLAMAIDWTFGRHGADLRRDRRLAWRWLDRPGAWLAWASLAAGTVAVVGLGCHFDLTPGSRPRHVFVLGLIPGVMGRAVGVAIVALAFALAAWWTGIARRSIRLLASRAGFGVGSLLGLGPFLIYQARVGLGLSPLDQSLSIWIRPPWAIGPNVADGLATLGPLIAGETDGGRAPYLCLGPYQVPAIAWPGVARALAAATPGMTALVLALVATTAWRDRASWRGFWALRGEGPTPPTVLAAIGLGACAGLYLLQASSLDGSSGRYLLPVWIFLPGPLASALLAWPRPARRPALALLLGVWALGQANLLAEMARPNLERRLARRLEGDGVRAIVANGPLAQIVADLSAGRVGGVEYHWDWPRLGRRYADRFPPDGPITCVVDLDRHGPAGDDPGPSVLDFSAKHPGRARLVDEVEHYQVWRLDVPLGEFLGGPGDPLPEGGPSAIVAR